MTSTLLGITVLAIVVFFASWLFFHPHQIRRAVGYLFYSNTVFILLGLLLGPRALGLISNDAMQQFSPVLSVVLSWVAFYYGIQMNWKLIQDFPVAQTLHTLLETAVSIACVSLVFFLLLPFYLPAGQRVGTSAFALGIMAGGSSAMIHFLLARHYRAQGPLTRSLRFISGLDDLLGLILWGLLFCYGGELADALFPFILRVVISIGLGFLFGLIADMMIKFRCEAEELIIILVGLVILMGGTSSYFSLSPLFIPLIAGVVVANRSHRFEEIHRILKSMEKPFYLFLLMWCGAQGIIDFNLSFLLAIIYVSARLGAKVVGGYAATWGEGKRALSPERFYGLGLMGQGGIVVAMMVNWLLVENASAPSLVLGIFIWSMLINEVTGRVVAYRLLSWAGEVRRPSRVF